MLRECMTTQLRPVSYKWLAREMNMTSNEAKRIMEQFASSHCDKVDALWLIGGYTSMTKKNRDEGEEEKGSESVSISKLSSSLQKSARRAHIFKIVDGKRRD